MVKQNSYEDLVLILNSASEEQAYFKTYLFSQQFGFLCLFLRTDVTLLPKVVTASLFRIAEDCFESQHTGLKKI